MVINLITPFWQIQLYCIYYLNCVVTGWLHIGQIFFLKVTYLCCKTPFYDYILGSMLLSTSQSVHRWQQCTSRLLPSCPTLPSWPSNLVLGGIFSLEKGVVGIELPWDRSKCCKYCHSLMRMYLITFDKIPMTSLVSEWTFYENGRRWICFHNSISCFIWICQNGVIGFLTINSNICQS